MKGLTTAITVTSVEVLVRKGHTDIIFINTPYKSNLCGVEFTTLKCEAAYKRGADWVRSMFGIEPKVINAD